MTEDKPIKYYYVASYDKKNKTFENGILEVTRLVDIIGNLTLNRQRVILNVIELTEEDFKILYTV